jgi:serine/threonine-protein kinase RsbW
MTSNQLRKQISWEYPASLSNVEQVCSDCAQFLMGFSLSQKDRFAIHLLLRESINNAVIHGCQHNPLLLFTCKLTLSDHEATIEVHDEGKGFDWRSERNTSPNISSESGRGLYIYSIYADTVEYNEAGNCVMLTRIFNRGEKNG